MLGVSVATARRMAASGRIPATKTGKQWIVDGSNLRHAPRRRRVSAVPTVDLEQALRHVQATDLAEEWIPDVLRHEDLLAHRHVVIADAQARINDLSPGPATEVEVDKTVVFTRPATTLELPDRLAYQAVVAAFADRVEAETPDEVFSARLATGSRRFMKPGTRQWVAWREHVFAQLVGPNEWMVQSDLTAHFDTIPHDALIAELRSLNVEQALLDPLISMLRAWQPVDRTGLPQGPNASRLLANLHLLPVDRAMLRGGWQYSRFMDDVRIVTTTRGAAVDAIRMFQRECRARGLIVSSSKTRLLHGDDARASLLEEEDLTTVEYFLERNATRTARGQLRRILRKALKSLDVDDRRVRFSLWRLTKLREASTLRLVLTHLEDLGPHASSVAGYLRPFITRGSVVNRLAAFLGDRDQSRSRYLTTWLFAAMLEHPGRMPRAWAMEAATRVHDRNEPAYLRSIAAVVMARGGLAADIAWIKAEIQREHDPSVLRGYAVALHWTRELDRGTQRRLVAKAPRLQNTLDYLKGRPNLPSLVHREADLVIT